VIERLQRQLVVAHADPQAADHPFQFGQGDPRLQQEVWGEDHDTWTASPYALIGKARRVDGGFILSGQWPFSSGTDHCKWAVIGGMAESEPGVFNVPYHFCLPRADYEILQDSWNVMGLCGTGSKDLVVNEVFVPEYRTYKVADLNERVYAARHRPDSPLYQIPFDLFFPGGISIATIGIAAGVVNHFADYTGSRVTRMGTKQTQNPYHMASLGAALADISRVSNRLAELIQGISFATGLQATSANGVAHNMQHILSVTEHTQAGTRQTAQSIRQLAALAQELKNSVSRFRVAQ